MLKELELLVDSYEQSIYRPDGYDEQKKYYSGKKKTHTLKNQIISMPCGLDVVDVNLALPGPTSDINIWRSVGGEFARSQKFTL